jgi:cytochrome c peroxidase
VVRFNSNSSNSNNNTNGQWNHEQARSFDARWAGAAAAFAIASGALVAASSVAQEDAKAADVNVAALRANIVSALNNAKYEDGSYGPVVVRLAWHAAGTYDKVSGTGGSDGATMRYEPESKHGANAGLEVARALLEPIAKKYPGVTVADLWQFAAVVAIEEMGGPKVPFRFGRIDKTAEGCTPDGRLPDASQGSDHVRNVFYRMGFNDQEIVALLGAHALGRCHTTRSGYDGPWTKAPTMFSNDFYRLLLDEQWKLRNWKGPAQYEDKSKTLMMLPTDLVLIKDPKFREFVEIYAKDEEKFFKDFAAAFSKLQENGVKAFQKPWYQFW